MADELRELIDAAPIRGALGVIADHPEEFTQILWDPERGVLSFRMAGGHQYANLWLDPDGQDGHVAEFNGIPAAGSKVLWERS